MQVAQLSQHVGLASALALVVVVLGCIIVVMVLGGVDCSVSIVGFASGVSSFKGLQ